MCKKKAPFSSPPLRGGVSAKQTGWGNIFYLQIKKWASFKKAIEDTYRIEEKRVRNERLSIILPKFGPGLSIYIIPPDPFLANIFKDKIGLIITKEMKEQFVRELKEKGLTNEKQNKDFSLI